MLFLLRLYETGKPIYNVSKNKGRIIDIEEKDGKMKENMLKQSELKEKNETENLTYEKIYNYKNYKKNGLSNLNYDVIDKFEYDNNYHIIVDLKKEEDEKLYPDDYFFKESVNKEVYKSITKKIFDIKQIEF